jgi:hypothetical protein
MKNFMNFKEFSVNERYDWGNSDWDSYYGKTRENKLSKALQDISNDLRQSTRATGDSELTPAKWIIAKGLSSLFNLGASAADWRKSKKKKSEEDNEKEEKENKEREEVRKEWEEFIKSSEKTGLDKFGPDWTLLNPRTPEERRYSERVRKRELELIDKMTRR